MSLPASDLPSSVADAHPGDSPCAVYLLPLLILGVAATLAVVCYVHFLPGERLLWSSTIHDRNAHFDLGLSLAEDVRQGSIGHLLQDLDRARTWPPLHGILAAGVLLIGGRDHRLAVLPSLLGWVGTVLLGFLVARRAVPRGGNLAGLVAALFILASPAHRAYATDVMLESLGACLTLLVLYCYLVAVQGGSRAGWRWLGLALTALFFEKYNYWLLIALALAAMEVPGRPRCSWRVLHAAFSQVDGRRWLRSESRQPLNYLLAPLLLLMAGIAVTGGFTLQLAGRPVLFQGLYNLVHVAYGIVFLRFLRWWWRSGRAWTGQLEWQTRQLLFWHAWPVALWFLWPQRLGYFLWFLSPSNVGEAPQSSFLDGLANYWQHLAQDYHLGAGSAGLALLLTAAAALTARRLRPGGQAVLWVVLVAGLLTLHHPNQKSRFLHSWVAAGWIAAGVGLAQLVHGRLTRRAPRARPWLATAAAGGVAVLCLPGFFQAGHAQEAGFHPERPSALALTDAYLPILANARRSAIVSTLPLKFLAHWSFLERYGQLDGIDTELKGVDLADVNHRQGFDHWLAATSDDTLVFIDVPPTSPYSEAACGFHAYDHLRELLAAQSRFQLAQQIDLAGTGCSVTVWKACPQMNAAAPAVNPSADARHF